MNGDVIQRLVHDAIGDAWDLTNDHSVDLRKSLVRPRSIKVIERLVRDGKIHDKVIDVWLVLVERPESQAGYRIVADADGQEFGLASDGFASDEHLVLSGWYGDFLSAFKGM